MPAMNKVQRKAEPELMDEPQQAQAYASADFGAVNQAFVQRLLELAGERRAAQVVDLGTGPGDIPLRIAAAKTDWQITAVDGAPAMLHLAKAAIAQARRQGQIRLLLADAKALPLADGAFDIVVSNSLLHHVADPLPLWREIRRIAQPGGIIFVRDLIRPADETAARQIVQQYAGSESALLQEEFCRSLLAAYTLAEVRAQLQATDLGHLKVTAASDRHLDVFGLRH
jgi:ubiquinone/menaquinone biosynthesis C-methylase UbiE